MAVAAGRAKPAHEGLVRFFCGDRPNEGQYIARWYPLSQRAWAAGQDRPPDLLLEEMGDLWPVAWEGRTVGSLKDPRYHLDGCVGPCGAGVSAFRVVYGRARWAA